VLSTDLRRLSKLAGSRRAFRLSEARDAGVHPEMLRRLAARGDLIRLSRGLYALPGVEATEHHTLATVASRIPRAVICLLSALRFHALGTQHPRDIWVAIDRRRAVPKPADLPLRIVRISAGLLTFGVDTHEIEGVPVLVTSPARTVADCFKFRNRVGTDVAVEALREYVRTRKGTPDDLWQCAERLRVLNVIRPYWEGLSA
jgi:predicted transcriptional regulator of viral defense system